ncbi:hypothetical protein MTO96_041591 [Rhipicephalus appendiculatus]
MGHRLGSQAQASQPWNSHRVGVLQEPGGSQDWKTAKAPAVFTKELNDLFDVFNAKLPKEGIRPGSSKQKDLTECKTSQSKGGFGPLRKAVMCKHFKLRHYLQQKGQVNIWHM